MSRESLEKSKARYERLKHLTGQSGWSDFMEILTEEYHELLRDLKSPKYVRCEVEARGALKLIDRVMSKVNSELKFGKHAKEKFVQKYITASEE